MSGLAEFVEILVFYNLECVKEGGCGKNRVYRRRNLSEAEFSRGRTCRKQSLLVDFLAKMVYNEERGPSPSFLL